MSKNESKDTVSQICNTEIQGKLKRDFVISCLEACNLDNSEIWFSPIGSGNCRLIEHYWPKNNTQFQLVEIYKDNENGKKHIRLYRHKNGSKIETVFIGSMQTLRDNTFWENLPIIPTNGELKKTGIYKNDPIDLGILSTLQQIPNLHYLVRPTSRILTKIIDTKIQETSVQINYYENKIKPKEHQFFLLVSPASKSNKHKDYFKRMLITNDVEYMNNQDRLTWDKL